MSPFDRYGTYAGGESRLSRKLLLIGIAYLAACSRSPHALAERFSGLDVPTDAEVLEFVDEESGFAGSDLYVKVVLRLSSTEAEHLTASAPAAGFDALEVAPATASSPVCEIELASLLDPGSRALVRVEPATSSDCGLAVLDPEQRTLTVVRLIL